MCVCVCVCVRVCKCACVRACVWVGGGKGWASKLAEGSVFVHMLKAKLVLMSVLFLSILCHRRIQARYGGHV